MSYIDHKLQSQILKFLYRKRYEKGMVSFKDIVRKRGLQDPHSKITLADLERKELVSLDIDYKKLGSKIDHHSFVIDELRLNGKLTDKGIEKCRAEIKFKIPIIVSIGSLIFSTLISICIQHCSADSKEERINQLEAKVSRLDSLQKP